MIGQLATISANNPFLSFVELHFEAASTSSNGRRTVINSSSLLQTLHRMNIGISSADVADVVQNACGSLSAEYSIEDLHKIAKFLNRRFSTICVIMESYNSNEIM